MGKRQFYAMFLADAFRSPRRTQRETDRRVLDEGPNPAQHARLEAPEGYREPTPTIWFADLPPTARGSLTRGDAVPVDARGAGHYEVKAGFG
jgi:hypothetical protein